MCASMSRAFASRPIHPLWGNITLLGDKQKYFTIGLGGGGVSRYWEWRNQDSQGFQEPHRGTETGSTSNRTGANYHATTLASGEDGVWDRQGIFFFKETWPVKTNLPPRHQTLTAALVLIPELNTLKPNDIYCCRSCWCCCRCLKGGGALLCCRSQRLPDR